MEEKKAKKYSLFGRLLAILFFVITYFLFAKPIMENTKQEFKNHPDANRDFGSEPQYVKPEDSMPWFHPDVPR